MEFNNNIFRRKCLFFLSICFYKNKIEIFLKRCLHIFQVVWIQKKTSLSHDWDTKELERITWEWKNQWYGLSDIVFPRSAPKRRVRNLRPSHFDFLWRRMWSELMSLWLIGGSALSVKVGHSMLLSTAKSHQYNES